MDNRVRDLVNNFGYWGDEAVCLVKQNEKRFNALSVDGVFLHQNGEFTGLYCFSPMKQKPCVVKSAISKLHVSPKIKKKRSLKSSFENVKNLRSLKIESVPSELFVRIYDLRRKFMVLIPSVMESQSAEIQHTVLADFLFDSECISYNECVAAILESRIDCDDDSYFAEAEDLLFGQHSDKKLYSFLGNLFWDGLLNPTLVLPYRFRTMLEGVDCNNEWAIMSRFSFLAGDSNEDYTIMTSQSDLPDIMKTFVNLISYQEIMTTLKPIVTISGLYNIWNAEDWTLKLAEIMKLMEAHNLYWNLNTEKLTVSVDCLITLFKNVENLPELFSTYISGGDAVSIPPNSGVMQSEAFEIDEKGMLAKALNFGKEFGISSDVIKSFGPIAAMFSTSIVAIALIGCGDKIQTDALSGSFDKLIHSVAMSCRDWKIVLSSLEATWKFIASGLGQFLGFTYMDENQAIRNELVNKIEKLRSDLQELEDTKYFKFDSLSDPLYFQQFNTQFEKLEKLISDVMRSDKNLASLKLEIDGLKTKFETIKEEFNTLFHSICGKQQPTTIWVGSPLSGIGKTTFMEFCQEKLSEESGRQLTKYVRNSMEAYWSTYVYQDIVHLRDFGQSAEEQEHIELINIYDPANYQLAMSDNNQKGRQFKSRFVFIDSNQLYIRRSKTTNDPRKLDRRRDFLFEAFSDYPKTEAIPNPPKDLAIKHLILQRINPIGTDIDEDLPERVSRQDPVKAALDQARKAKHIYSDNTLNRFFTLDGRVVTVDGVQAHSGTFDELIKMMIEHERINNEDFRNRSKIKYQQMLESKQKKEVLNDESTRSAISINSLNSKRIVILRGPSGCGKTFTAHKFRGQRIEHEEFTRTPGIREYILRQFNQCSEDVILTTNPNDYDEWISQWEYEDGEATEEKIALERRCLMIDYSFAKKPSSVINRVLFTPEYYNHQDVEQFPSEYSRFVNFHINGQRKTYTEILHLIENNKDIKTDTAILYHAAPRFSMDESTVRNFVRINMPWSEMDTIKSMTGPFKMLSKIEIIKSEFSLLELKKSFGQIVNDVFKHYELRTNLEDGLIQLNSLRIDAPMEFDCLVKLDDASFILTTDDKQKLVFCMVDHSFNYREEEGKIFCYLKDQLMWEETGYVALWYKHLLRNVEKIQVNYQNITPPSANLVAYCDHFLNFVKTVGAGFAIFKLCSPALKFDSERGFDIYSHLPMKKSESLKTDGDPDEKDTSRPKITHSSQNYKVNSHMVKSRFLGESLKTDSDPDEQTPSRPQIHHKTDFKIYKNYKVRARGYESESSIDPGANTIAKITMDQNYPLKFNGKHIAFAQGIFEDIILTIGHISEGVQIEIDGCLYDLELLSLNERNEKAILRVINLPRKFRDIRKYFQKVSSTHTLDGMHAALYTWDDDRTTRVEKSVILCEQRQQSTTTGLKYGMIYQVNSVGHIAPIQTGKGWCGSPLIIANSSVPEKIIGLHTAADNYRGLSSLVFQSDFNHLIQESESIFENETIDILPFQQVVLSEEDLPSKFSDRLKLIGKPGKIVDGEFLENKIHSCNQTQYHRSPFSTGDELTCEPAILDRRDPRCTKELPDILITGVNKFGREQPNLDLEILDECYAELTEKLVHIIREAQIRTKVLTMTEVINGCSLYETSPPMNMQSGTGYPHNFEFSYVTQKRNMFDFDVEKGIYKISSSEAGQKLHSDISSYLSYLQNTSSGQSAVIYVAAKKDEPRPMEKIHAMSTRAFFMGPTYHFMAFKQYYGAAQALLTFTNSVSPFKIGIDPACRQFDTLYNYLASVSEIGMNGDYTGFDNCHPEEYLKRNARVYNAIYRATDPDWREEDDQMRNRLAEQEQRPLVLVDGLIVQCPGGNMSGGPDTGGRNNIAGCVNMRYAWKILSSKYDPSKYFHYDLYTVDAVFGDDIIKSVATEVQSWYNPQNIKEVISTLGFKITAADKQEELMFKPLNELTFLKRNFSEVEIEIKGVPRKYRVGALENSVFVKMLNWCKTTRRHFFRRDSPVHFDRLTIGDTVAACLSEACLKGEDFFDQIKLHLINSAREYEIKLPVLPTFKQAFFQTYFKESLPAPSSVNFIELDSNNFYSPLFHEDFRYGNNTFKTIYQCYEYQRSLYHHNPANVMNNHLAKCKTILDNPDSAHIVGRSYVSNSKFSASRLMRNVIRARFSQHTFVLNDVDMFVNKQNHEYFGKSTNEYGKLLTEFAMSHRMAPESKAKNIDKISKINVQRCEKRIEKYQENLVKYQKSSISKVNKFKVNILKNGF
jgi:hypothetical protein